MNNAGALDRLRALEAASCLHGVRSFGRQQLPPRSPPPPPPPPPSHAAQGKAPPLVVAGFGPMEPPPAKDYITQKSEREIDVWCANLLKKILAEARQQKEQSSRNRRWQKLANILMKTSGTMPRAVVPRDRRPTTTV